MMRLYHCYYCILLLPSAAITGVTANSLERFDSRVTPPANARDVAGQRGGVLVTRMLRVQETIDTEQRMISTGALSKMKTMLGLVESDTNKLLTIAKAHTLSQQQSASNADRAIEFLTALTDKNLGLFKKHLVKTVKKRKQPEELDADTLVAKFLVTSFGDETLAKAFVKLGDADELLAASKVRSMVFRKWAAEGKKLKDIIPLLKVTDDVEIFEPQVTNFLLKFGKETEGPDFLISDVNEAMLRHWGGNYARYISGILRWEAKQGGAAKFTAGSRYHWALSDLTQYPTSPDSLVNNLKIIQGQHSYLRDGEYLHLTDDQLKKVGEDYAHVLKLVSGDPV